ELNFDFSVCRREARLIRHLEKNTVINHLIQELKLQVLCFLGRRGLFGACSRLELLFQLRRCNFLTVDPGSNIPGCLGFGAAGWEHQGGGEHRQTQYRFHRKTPMPLKNNGYCNTMNWTRSDQCSIPDSRIGSDKNWGIEHWSDVISVHDAILFGL